MSEVTRLHFPRLTRRAVRSQNLLARMHCFPFTLGNEAGTLFLLPGHASRPTTFSHWTCALGHFSLGDATPVFNLLSLSPFSGQPDLCAEDTWQTILFNQYLSPELARLFGNIAPGDVQEPHELCARLHIRLGDRHSECPLLISHSGLAHWLKQPGWQRMRSTLAETLVYSQPLVLGHITLHTPELQALSAGDVLVPPVSYFTPDGKGSLILAGQQLYGELQLPHHFLLNHMESTVLDPYADDEFDAVSQPETLITDENLQLASLPLSLQVRCGRTRLTLGELQQLQTGSVLTLDNVTPGEAGLYHGETLIAHGELVDVEGHLGLQLTRLLLTSQQEAG
ncbi:type III secretion system cytoplasmic ring protein SctQ [Pantoea agglomerans]|uniref:Type III secretion system cytoplasmic ring protein SctQ n=1 Tax=Enterobacter agglomerans TaxID=549 RepID=A0AAN2K8D0_ENTAG|nr:type III secretion system cytoplasmic ring protein SctQ [Pantoea agglomerans]CAH6373656.1 type III secretion system cytoplasmic ring protein SctQ [Pantoea agglomerans]